MNSDSYLNEQIPKFRNDQKNRKMREEDLALIKVFMLLDHGFIPEREPRAGSDSYRNEPAPYFSFRRIIISGYFKRLFK